MQRYTSRLLLESALWLCLIALGFCTLRRGAGGAEQEDFSPAQIESSGGKPDALQELGYWRKLSETGSIKASNWVRYGRAAIDAAKGPTQGSLAASNLLVEAETALNRGLAINPSDPFLNYEMGRLYRARASQRLAQADLSGYISELEKAVQHFDSVLSNRPSSSIELAARTAKERIEGRLALFRKLEHESRVRTEELRRMSPEDRAADVRKSAANTFASPEKKARLGVLRKQIEAGSTDAKTWQEYGALLMDMHFYAFGDRSILDEAKAAFERAITLDPKHARAHFGLGQYYEVRGEKEAALQEYEKALSLDSGDFLARRRAERLREELQTVPKQE
jgi:tetratricopeptide (TPR) repeat protein